MDYLLSHEEMQKVQRTIADLKEENKSLQTLLDAQIQLTTSLQEQLTRTQNVLNTERHTTSLVLQKIDQLNAKLARCGNTYTRITFNELV